MKTLPNYITHLATLIMELTKLQGKPQECKMMRGWETEPRGVGQLATEQESLGCGFLPSSCALFLFSFFPLLRCVTTGLTSSFYSVILCYLSFRLSGK